MGQMWCEKVGCAGNGACNGGHDISTNIHVMDMDWTRIPVVVNNHVLNIYMLTPNPRCKMGEPTLKFGKGLQSFPVVSGMNATAVPIRCE